MRMSCNGCRVLRKRCSETCILRPCLEWIRSEESQANATVFLAKFYGRTGLINLISNGPQHSRPALFRSLLYEACGRLSNPICGAVGLFCSGNWELCQAGVDSILDGSYHADMANKSSLPNTRGEQNKEQHTVMPSISSELHKINARGKFKSVNHRKKPKSKELQLLKSIQSSSGEAQGRGIDIAKMHQDNSGKEKCSFESLVSQQRHDLVCQTNCNDLYTINPNADALYLQNCEDEMEVELTLGASSPPTHKLAD